MKTVASLLLITLLAGSNGCMTCAVLDGAKAETHKDDNGRVIVDEKSHPAYYALLPLSIPADIATSPIQAVYFGIMLHDMSEPNGIGDQIFGAILAKAVTQPLDLDVSVTAFRRAEKRWPKDYAELATFVKESDGKLKPISYDHVDFTNMPDGSLQIHASGPGMTNSVTMEVNYVDKK